MEIIRSIFITILLCSATMASAQQSFTQRVTARRTGDATVVLHQDATLDALVNGTATTKTTKAKDKGSANKTSNGSGTTESDPATTTITTTTSTTDAADEQTVVESTEIEVGNGYKIYRNSMKTPGFRVQVYSGGNSRTAKQAAESTAREVKSHFPNQPVYTHFNSPRWTCRVGDFRSMEEANELLRQMKETGKFGQATIVKCVVQIAL